ncbi:MAG: hypothetical protein NTY15_04905 [Planctomycetota bacterium]|nr:hypothetical protein [Planctomycetota bacterium]
MKTWVFQSILMSAAFLGQACFVCAQTASPSDSKSVAAAPGLSPRKLASGVMTVVAPDQDSEDTALGPFDLEFVAKHPELEWSAPDFPENKPHYASPSETLLNLSRDIIFRHEVWGLEFSFKPVRLIEVDVPKDNGKFQKKVVWYMVYNVRYKGEDLSPNVAADVPTPPDKVTFESVRFISRFALLSKEQKLNLDAQILPTAVDAIAAKERIGKPLHDHIEIGKIDIKASTLVEDNSVWGVATWTDVDPRVDFFAVDVRGLTNAYKIRIDEEGKKNFDRKTLRIYHWRPGDSIDESKDRILLGLPAFENAERVDYYLKQFNLKERLDYQWIYR